jgi:glycosyltransferase involved in cell wall biosynthesis
VKVLAYPKDWNPYQELLYRPLRDRHAVTVAYGRRYPGVGPLPFFVVSALQRLRGYRLLHVHWQSFHIDPRVPGARWLSYWSCLLWFRWLRLLRYRVVWTVHNVVPHEAQTADDTAVAQRLSLLAHAKIVHSHHTTEQMQRLGIDTTDTVVIPHGNYIGVYPGQITPGQARQRLAIPEDELVVLFIGNIRPYKGVDTLLEVFQELDAAGTRLVIAGECADRRLKRRITAAQRSAAITFHDGRVDDKDLSTYLTACDVVCLPFRAITTSGSALLALSFGKPLVASHVGAIRDLPGEVGAFYRADQAGALHDALRHVLCNDAERRAMAKAAVDYSKTLSWDRIADRTYRVYADVLARTARHRN